MPRQSASGRGHRGVNGRGSRGIRRGGRGARRGVVQKTKFAPDPFRKFKHIQRNQEAEDILKQRKLLEGHQKLQAHSEHIYQTSSDDEDSPMDQLLGLLQATKNKSHKFTAIESSDSEQSALGIDKDIKDSEAAIECDSSDEADLQINETFEKQSGSNRREAVFSKDGEPSSHNDKDMDELTSSDDEDQDLILRPEEFKGVHMKLFKEHVNLNSHDNSDSEEDVENEMDLNDVETDEEDMFSTHLDRDLSQSLLECVNTTHLTERHNLHWPKLGQILVEIPKAVSNQQGIPSKKHKMLLNADEQFAKEGVLPKRLDHKTASLLDYGLKSQMQSHVLEANTSHLKKNSTSSLLTGLQCELFSVMNNYQDIYFPARTHDNGEEVRFTYCLHALNHILKTRTKILHHNAKLSKVLAEKGNVPSILPENFRDQGLFRPKILIVVPFRDSALRVVNILISLIFPEKGSKVMHYDRFQEEFGGEGLYFPKRNPKPEDYERTFAGNSDDTFRIGICLTRKCMKLYSDFYMSDILIVSPLGLRMVVGAPGEKDRDYDFLASIELMILDQADLFLAQNWDHLLHVIDHLHLQPQSARNTDFSRVRSWCLNGWARFYRQTLLFTSHELPEFRSLFNGRCANYRGRLRVANPVAIGTIHHVAVQVPQVLGLHSSLHIIINYCLIVYTCL